MLRNTPDLDSIRSRAEFQELLRQVERRGPVAGETTGSPPVDDTTRGPP